jgi:hypothetical protein
MQAPQRWARLEQFAPGMDQEVQLWWAEFHTDDDGRNPDRPELLRFLRDPIDALRGLDLGAGTTIDDEWSVHSSFTNHGFGMFWQRCLVALMISPLERTVAIHAWKVRPPSKRPPGWSDTSDEEDLVR